VLKVAICGGSGYTGGELLRLLSRHPHVEISTVTSERSEGKPVSEHFPHLLGFNDQNFVALEPSKLLKKADLFFLALPHAASQEAGNFFYRNKKYVIDLSADFRLKDPRVYERWYGVKHVYPSLLKRAVYGLPEVYRKKIRRARLIANPGCYPTGALLGIYPLLTQKIVDEQSFIIDSKSGTSGAGRKSDSKYSFCEINESFMAYSVAEHRHAPEIEQELSFGASSDIKVNFTPHLLPINRGILTTIYCSLKKKLKTADLLNRYRRTYSRDHFIRIHEEGKYPDLKNVRGTNFCDIGLKVNHRTGTLIIISAMDNLMKGASGQAVQSMNIMMGFPETEGLDMIAPLP
jgi:N-acetyl-gamma-glutamyl-phosphate reductase